MTITMLRLLLVVSLCAAILLGVNSFEIPSYRRLSKRQQQRNVVDVYNARNDDYQEDSSPTSTRRIGRIRPKKPLKVVERQSHIQEEIRKRREEALKDPTLLSEVSFADRDDLHPSTKRALTERMGLKEMTQVQAKTYALAVSGKNIVARARTGTGKTLAFLLPCLERLLGGDKDLYIPGIHIGMLVIAPTRELVIQISNEAEKILSFHPKDYSVGCIYGGTKMHRDISLFLKKLPTVLVTTPGRLRDHIAETRIRGKKFSDIISQTKIVVLDEMDMLLDLGFKREILQILSCLPRPEKRQSLMLSATIPSSMKKIMPEIMRTDYEEVICVDESDVKSHTNLRVEQSFLLLRSMDQFIPALVEIVTKAMQTEQYKVLVFFPTTKLVSFFVEYFRTGLNIRVCKLHSRMSQSSRQRASAAFRKSSRTIMFTSDVSARGVDYPDVTLVVQYGSPNSSDLYIHRLGRTGRAGKQGKGQQILLPFESKLVGSLKRSGVTEEKISPKPRLDASIAGKMKEAHRRVRSGDVVLTNVAEGAYRSFVAYYVARKEALGLSLQQIVDAAEGFSNSAGLTKPPSLDHKIAARLGIEGMQGVNIAVDGDGFQES